LVEGSEDLIKPDATVSEIIFEANEELLAPILKRFLTD
jgi:hypothetical protein